jgi:hypothetical protein
MAVRSSRECIIVQVDESGYRLGGQFILRLAGLPIEELERLRSPRLAEILDQVILATDRGTAAAARAHLAECYPIEIDRARRAL